MAKRVIAHLDCDAFYATVELIKRPELRGKPLIVSGNGPRAVVTTASYEARKFGVGSAMPTSRALRLCPGAILIPPDFPAYRETSRRVWELVRAGLPVVQQVGLDEAYADLGGLDKPLRVLRELLGAVHAETGITVSAGIAPNRLIAKIASDLDKPAGFVAMGREQACEVLADRSTRLIPGIGPKSAARLEELGFTTIGDLQRAGREALVERFGERQGGWLHARSHFHDDAPVRADSGPAKSRSNERTFDTDVSGLPALEPILVDLATGLAEGCRAKGKRGRTVAIKVRLDDWTTVTRARTFDRYVDDTETVRETALALLRDYDPPRPVRLLGVRMAAFEDVEALERESAPEEPADQLALPL